MFELDSSLRILPLDAKHSIDIAPPFNGKDFGLPEAYSRPFI